MKRIWLKNYQAGVPAEINIDEHTSLADLFLQSCEKFKPKIAYQNFGAEISYQQLAALSRNFAAYLQKKYV